MKTFILIYPTFVQYEVVFTSMFMKTVGDIATVGIDGREVTSHEGFKVNPHMKLSDLNLDEVDLFVIPGGEHVNIYGNPQLTGTLRELNKRGKVIAAICSGPVHLAKAGLLDGKRYTSYRLPQCKDDFSHAERVEDNVVVDGNIVTAKAVGYVDLALELGKIFNIYKDEA
ncbi:MAG TPA: DJ-1/PfpI family protein, partial [Clostridia bacterium]|nr:DJ-1/PfpI family protein [Clostridia bacterium]